MYYSDMSPYEYTVSAVGSNRVVNVGWLERNYLFQTGEVPAALLPAIARLIPQMLNATRGIHLCSLCKHASMNELPTLRVLDRDYVLGSAEILVRGLDGTDFAAPNLIYHYIVEHKYLPPDAFCRALTCGADASVRSGL